MDNFTKCEQMDEAMQEALGDMWEAADKDLQDLSNVIEEGYALDSAELILNGMVIGYKIAMREHSRGEFPKKALADVIKRTEESAATSLQ